MNIAEERVSEVWDEAQPLVQANWEETGFYADIPLDPHREYYQQIEDAGQLRCYTVREDGKLVGYQVFYLQLNIHHKTSLQAVLDVLFILSDYRKSGAAIRFIRYAERALKAEGVQAVYYRVNRANQVGRLLTRLGYNSIEEVYAKRLDQGV